MMIFCDVNFQSVSEEIFVLCNKTFLPEGSKADLFKTLNYYTRLYARQQGKKNILLRKEKHPQFCNEQITGAFMMK